MKNFIPLRLLSLGLSIALIVGGLKWWLFPASSPYIQKLEIKQFYSTSLPNPLLKAPATWDSEHIMRSLYASVESAKTSDEIAEAWTVMNATRLGFEQSKENFVKSYKNYPPSLAMYQKVWDPVVPQAAENVAASIFQDMLSAFNPLDDAIKIKQAQIKDRDINDATGEVKLCVELSRQASIKAHFRWLRLQESGMSLLPTSRATAL